MSPTVPADRQYPIQSRWMFKGVLFLIPVAIFMVFLGPAFFILLFCAMIQMVTLYLRRRTFSFTLDPAFLTVHQGIFSRQERHVPYGVIQHLVRKQDLADRLLGLTTIVIENASSGGVGQSIRVNRRGRNMEMPGFSGNRITIPGLTSADAEALRTALLTAMHEHQADATSAGL